MQSPDFYEFSSGTTRTILHTSMPWWYGAAISPGGRVLLFSAVRHAGGHLMMVERFR